MVRPYSISEDSSQTETENELSSLTTPMPTLSLFPELESFIGPQGLLSKLLPHYERRLSQERMMRAVAHTLHTQGEILIEAGTGVGKSLAYLLPALLSGKRVLVSTGTKTLQDQLTTQQIPFLQQRLGLQFSWAILKGRRNYLCLSFLQQHTYSAHFTLSEHVELQHIRNWAEHTVTGDKAELIHLSDHSPAWGSVAADADRCTGRACDFFNDCFLMRARRAAEAADLVIVNHHLLLADLNLRDQSKIQIIPNAQALILDEAHHIPALAVRALGHSLSEHRLKRLHHDILRTWRDLGLNEEHLSSLLQALLRGTELVWSWLKESTIPLYLLLQHAPLEEAWTRLDHALSALELTLSTEAKRQLSIRMTAHERLSHLTRRTLHLRELLEHVFTPPLTNSEGVQRIAWLEPTPNSVSIYGSRAHQGQALQELLGANFESVVYTSATLSQGPQDFRFILKQLGLPASTLTLELGSPFSFEKQALFYVPSELPPPSHPEFPPLSHEHISDLVDLSQGHALILFTSTERMKQAYQALGTRWPYPSWMQGEAPKEVLIQNLRTIPHGVLFGTMSFWEGVDVPGNQLRMVILEKLPFPNHLDSQLGATLEALERTGEDAFANLTLPLTVTQLRQGMGRLLRRRTDSGVVALLDSRIYRASYGPSVLKSLNLGEPIRVWKDLFQAWQHLSQH